jgi:superfamily I DNA/RNA helicase
MARILRLVSVNLALSDGRLYTDSEDAEALYESFFKWHSPWNRGEFARRSHAEKSFQRAATKLESEDKRWRGLAAAIAGLSVPMSPIGTIEYIGETFKNLRGLIGDLEQAVDGHVPLGELLDVARRFKGSTAEFHEALRGLARKAEQGLFASGEEDGVNLLTYFRAKGRQWHTVFLPGVNQRVIPDHRANVEDERRLFYVAVTRPTANLIVSYVRQAVREKVAPSQFLVEMGLGEGRERRAGAP